MMLLGIDWCPEEVILEVGSFGLRYYSFLFLLGFVLSWFIMKPIFLRERKALSKLESLIVHIAVGTVVGARLGHVFFYDWDYFKNHLLEIVLPFRFSPTFEFTGFAGLASHGAVIGILVATYVFVRKNTEFTWIWVLDRIVLPISLAGVCIRLGNFMNSEIKGTIVEKTFPFAVRFVRGGDLDPYTAIAATGQKNLDQAYTLIVNDPKYSSILESIPYRHPTQLYEAFGYIIVFCVLMWTYYKTSAKDKPGFLIGLFMILIWVIRFAAEFVKESQGGFESSLGLLSTGQWLSIPLIVLGFVLVARASRRYSRL